MQPWDRSHARRQNDVAGVLEPEASALLGRHVFQSVAEHFGADSILVTDLLQCAEERFKVDHAFAWEQPLVVADLLRRDLRRIGYLHMDNALPAGADDIR